MTEKSGEISQLYKAVKKGNMEAAKVILSKNKMMLTATINEWDETALHVALNEGHTRIVEYLINLMEDADLELKDRSSNTALHLAVQAGHVDIAKILVKMNETLLTIKGSDGKLPLQMAAVSGKHDMVVYLYEASGRMGKTHKAENKKASEGLGKYRTAENKKLWTAENRGCVLLACVEAELFDVAQDIVKDFPDLARSEGSRILEVLACKPHAFRIKKDLYQYDYGGHADVRRRAMQFLKSILSYFRNSKLDAYEGPANQGNQAVQLLKTILAEISKPELDNILRGFPDQIMKVEMPVEACKKYSYRVLFAAAEEGNTAFIDVLIRQYPKLVLELNDNKQNLFQVAALYHHTGIFKLLGNIGSVRESIYCIEDGNGNTLLHLAATLKETMTQQPNVQMEQAEIWFKMVSDMLPPSLREKKNKAGLTPSELFTKNHKELFFKVVLSVRKRISRLMMVASAVVTASSSIVIAFSSGYEQGTDKVIIPLNNFSWGMLWVVVSLLLAGTSLLLLLSIARSERDIISSSLYKIKLTVMVLVMSIMFLSFALLDRRLWSRHPVSKEREVPLSSADMCRFSLLKGLAMIPFTLLGDMF